MDNIATVRALRGAITVDANEEADILHATKLLLNEMVSLNDINTVDIISILFSMTSDLSAEFPGRAARELGWKEVPMLHFVEIDVPGSLRKCIRVLMHIRTLQDQVNVRHVYLRGASILRPDLAET